jgi:hypothetical protein
MVFPLNLSRRIPPELKPTVSPPTEKATTCQDQPGQPGTRDGAGDAEGGVGDAESTSDSELISKIHQKM